MGRLVQQAPPARTNRQLASRRGGSALLCPGRGTGLGRLTQAKPPPRNPARFKLDLGAVKANAQVAGFIFAAAKGGNVTAQIFWLKTRARWKEPPSDLRHCGALGTYEMSDGSARERLEAMIERAAAAMDATIGGPPQ